MQVSPPQIKSQERINQQHILPTATKDRHFGKIIVVSPTKTKQITLASGDSYIFQMITSPKYPAPLQTEFDISMFEGSIANNNIIPYGSAITSTDYQIIGPWREEVDGDGSNIVNKIFIKNVSTHTVSFNDQVNASVNDGGITSSGVWNFTNLNFLIGRSATPNDLEIGIRFTNVTIPQGSTINSSFFTLLAQTTKSATVSVKIYGINQDNTADFSTDPTGRPITSANVVWNLTGQVTDVDQSSPDISTIIQEIVNRGGWTSGNAMGFLVPNNGSANNNFLSYYTYDGNPSFAAFLFVSYTTGGASKTVIFKAQTRYLSPIAAVTNE